jgi:mannan endo-1,4-beta-mannosidase
VRTAPAVTHPPERKRRTLRTYVTLLICAVVVLAGGVTVLVVQPWQTTPAPPPVTSVRYLGVHVKTAPGTYAGISQFAGSIGVQPNIVSYYGDWLEPFQVGFARQAVQHGAVPLVQMDPTNVSLAAIAHGQYDGYLRSFGAAVKSFGSPVVISFGHEMNGNWSSWGNTHTSPATFVAAWRHIVDVVRQAGARNVTWLWTVNIVDSDLTVPIPDPADWWPGRSYVNWVGVDGYYYNSSTQFSSLFGPTLVDVRKLTSDPILIAETGAERSAGQAAKIGDLFAGVRTYGLLGFIWFDEDTEGHSWSITSPSAFGAYQRDARTLFRPPASAP